MHRTLSTPALVRGRGGRAGAVPDALSTLTDLEELLLADNDLGGTLPDGLSALTKLTRFEAGINNVEVRLAWMSPF